MKAPVLSIELRKGIQNTKIYEITNHIDNIFAIRVLIACKYNNSYLLLQVKIS